MPLLNVDTSSRAPYERLPDYNYASASEDEDSELDFNDSDGPPAKKKRWWLYLPLLVLIAFMLIPHYSIIMMLASYYLTIFKSPFLFVTHLFSVYLLTFLACCSLLVCVVRDPGAIRVGEDANGNAKSFSEASSSRHSREQSDDDENEETDMLDALRMKPTSAKATKRGSGEPEAFPDDFNAPHKWCKKCWAPKPERTHHCSACGRCVLKMDHHCPWLAHKCVGYWTYTAFLHFLLCVTLLSMYVGVLAGRIVYVAFNDPFLVDEQTALHSLFLTLYGAVFALVVGSFFLWHVYLASTNQTTIENISPFLLLRYLPSVSSASPAPAAVASPIVHTPVSASASLASLTHMKGASSTTSPSPTTPTSANSVTLNSPAPSRPAFLPSHSGSRTMSTPPPMPTPMPSSNGTSSFATVTTSIQRSAAVRNVNEGDSPSVVVAPPPTNTHSPYPPSSPTRATTLTSTPANSALPLHEHMLTSSQRRLVRSYASKIRLYDVGFKANWGQILSVGSRGWRGWIYRALCGGGGAGDGRRWPRDRKAEILLARLGEELRGEGKLD